MERFPAKLQCSWTDYHCLNVNPGINAGAIILRPNGAEKIHIPEKPGFYALITLT